MRKSEQPAVLKAISTQLERISDGPDGAGQRRLLDPILKRLDQEHALDMIAELTASYDASRDPYGKRKPRLSDFIRKANNSLNSGSSQTWMDDLRHGQVVQCSLGRDVYGIVEKAEGDTIIWTTAETPVHRMKYWAVVNKDQHAKMQWEVVSPNIAMQEIRAWWENWLNEVYDGPLPWGALKAAACRNNMVLEVDGKEFHWHMIMLDGKSHPVLKPDEPKVGKPRYTGPEPMAAILPDDEIPF